jgi:predicted DNA-binding transcriptional regulator AlpA
MTRLITDRAFELRLGVSRSTRKRLDKENATNPIWPKPVHPSPGIKRRLEDEVDVFIESLRAERIVESRRPGADLESATGPRGRRAGGSDRWANRRNAPGT